MVKQAIHVPTEFATATSPEIAYACLGQRQHLGTGPAHHERMTVASRPHEGAVSSSAAGFPRQRAARITRIERHMIGDYA